MFSIDGNGDGGGNASMTMTRAEALAVAAKGLDTVTGMSSWYPGARAVHGQTETKSGLISGTGRTASLVISSGSYSGEIPVPLSRTDNYGDWAAYMWLGSGTLRVYPCGPLRAWVTALTTDRRWTREFRTLTVYGEKCIAVQEGVLDAAVMASLKLGQDENGTLPKRGLDVCEKRWNSEHDAG